MRVPAGTWKTSIKVGSEDPGFANADFKVTLLLVDSKTALQFDTYVHDAIASDKYPGLGTETLTGTIEQVCSITVTRLPSSPSPAP